ncbi:MAG: thrombospondin type 3 repeat-containing protein, partial [Prosthecobacter sp.]
MKTTFFTALTLLLTHAALHAAAFVNETPDLLTTAADFDGDGDLDIAVLHRTSGVVSIGIRQANGTVIFRSPVSTGVPDASAMAVGRLLSTTRDTLAIAGPDANRVQIVNAADDALQFILSSYPAAAPRLLAALDIPGVGSSGLEDMMLAAGWPGTLPIESRRMANNGFGSFAASSTGFINAEIRGWNPVTLTRGGPVRLGFMEETQPDTLFRIAEPTAVSLTYPATTQAPTGSFTYGQFDVAESDFFFFTPASLSVTARRMQPSGTAFYAPLVFDFPFPIRQLVTLPDAVRDRVLIIPYSGNPAVYDYDGATGFTLVEEITLLGGAPEEASAAIALGDGSFMILHGDSTFEPPTAFSVYQKDGAGYTGIQENIDLPKLDEAPGINGNVFFFAGTPMRDDNPPLVGMWSVGDWSSNLTLGGSPQVSGELYQNATTGLGGLFNRAIVPLPSGATGALANQFMPDISVSNLHDTPAVLGNTSAGISFSPETATKHRKAVQVVISSSDPAASILFRKSNSGAFDLYAGPFWIFTDTTVEAYAQLPGGARTPVARANYVFDFTVQPKDQDSDGDGVPDFVERGYGLDPTAGPDSDGDGFSDLDEILAETSPTNPNEHPDPDARPATAAQMTVNVTPLPLDGTTNLPAYAQQNVTVEVHDVGGVLLGAADTSAPSPASVASITVDPIEAQ